MQIDRTSAIKLGTFASVTAVAGACHYLGLGEHAAGLFGTTLALASTGAHAIVGHLGLRLLENVSEDWGGAESSRAAQNRDVHRLIGEAIARILEREADGAPGDKFGVEYLRRAAGSFRSDWMTFDLAGTGPALREANAPEYFTGDAESIKKAPVLERSEWFSLVEEVAGKATFREYDQALDYAVGKLREGFASELWEGAKRAWNNGDLAWPELVLRLLGLIAREASKAAIHSEASAKQLARLREEIKTLGDAVRKAAAEPEDNIPNEPFPRSKDSGDAGGDDGDSFASSIKNHMAALDRRVRKLTGEQFYVINQLHKNNRVRIAGIAGSGKTLVAAEKSIRLANAGLGTLFLCHNPLLATHLSGLTRGSGVVVASFTQWALALAGTPSASNAHWSKYDEPTQDTLGLAFNRITSSADRYAAVIIDEGQDFRDEWWLLAEAALAEPGYGIFYIFYDDTQALLPHRARYPFDEPIIDLSRNCRNAGRIYELMRCLHPVAPLADRGLRKLGDVFMEVCSPGYERETIERAISWFPPAERERLTVLFAGDAAVTESIFGAFSLHVGQDVRWQDEVRRMFVRALRTRHTLFAPSLFENLHVGGDGEGIDGRLEHLSREPRPSPGDVRLVQETANLFKVRPDVRREILSDPNRREGLVWQIVEGKAKLRSRHRDIKMFASEIIMHFERDIWDVGLPPLRTVRFVRREARSDRKSVV